MAELRYRAARGTKDLLPGEAARWRRVEEVFAGVFARYGYGEIRLPIFEDTALFARGLGDTSDIVEKEMYTFPDRSGNSLTLRPEGTAAVVRAYLEHRLDKQPPPVKLWYRGPMFRYERPQKGRFRQFHQIGAEVFGLDGPEADAELLEMLDGAFRLLDVDDLSLEINSLGDADCRPAFREALVGHYRPHVGELCDDCRRRLGQNPLRLLDCKAAGCRALRDGAPAMEAYLCGPCRDHFEAVKGCLGDWDVPFTVNPAMVRGLDYYTRTTFEFTTRRLGSQDAVAAGGRYDGLVEEFGGPRTTGLGFALGMERLMELVPDSGGGEAAAAVFIAALGGGARREALGWLARLRRAGIAAESDLAGRSLKSQLRRADRLGARYVVIVGEEELSTGVVQLKDMVEKKQEPVEKTAVVDEVLKRLN